MTAIGVELVWFRLEARGVPLKQMQATPTNGYGHAANFLSKLLSCQHMC
jgi:hypothetical protein